MEPYHHDGDSWRAETEASSLLKQSPPPCSTQSAHLFTSSDTPSAVVVKPRGCLACPTLPDPACSLSWGLGGREWADSHRSWHSAAFHTWRVCWWLPACGRAPETVFLLNVFSLIAASGETVCDTPYMAVYCMNSRTPTELKALGGNLFRTH